MLIIAKPVMQTLDPNRLRKTGSRYNEFNDIPLYAVASESPRGLLYNVTKIVVSLHCLLCDLLQKPHLGGVILPPLPG